MDVTLLGWTITPRLILLITVPHCALTSPQNPDRSPGEGGERYVLRRLN